MDHCNRGFAGIALQWQLLESGWSVKVRIPTIWPEFLLHLGGSLHRSIRPVQASLFHSLAFHRWPLPSHTIRSYFRYSHVSQIAVPAATSFVCRRKRTGQAHRRNKTEFVYDVGARYLTVRNVIRSTRRGSQSSVVSRHMTTSQVRALYTLMVILSGSASEIACRFMSALASGLISPRLPTISLHTNKLVTPRALSREGTVGSILADHEGHLPLQATLLHRCFLLMVS